MLPDTACLVGDDSWFVVTGCLWYDQEIFRCINVQVVGVVFANFFDVVSGFDKGNLFDKVVDFIWKEVTMTHPST